MDRDDKGKTDASTNPGEDPVEVVDPTTNPNENGSGVDLGAGTTDPGSG